MVFIHKKGDSNDIKNYRPITLTSTISKLFHSIINHRLCTYLSHNKYVDQTMQKGFQKGIKGCVEHSLVLSKLLDAIRKRRHSAHVIWLDIANAFGSVPHSLVTLALESLHLPQWLTRYVTAFYHNIQVVGRTNHYLTDVIRVSRGVFQGDTLSPTIFVSLFNQILLYLRTEKQHGVSIKEEKISSLAFADDLTLVCDNARSAQRILNAVSSKLESNGLLIKPSKCYSLSLKSGCFDQSRKFSLNGVNFENINNAPMKFLGLNIYNKHQKANSSKYLQSKLSTLLDQVDKRPIDTRTVQARDIRWIHHFLPSLRPISM